MTPAAEATDRCLRRDAQENRQRILDAAREAFAQDGLDASLIDIARRAGVGNATVHRNFTKETLVDALFEDWSDRRRAGVARALEDPDPWHGLTEFLEDVIVDASRNNALLDIFMMRMPRFSERNHPLARLVRRAQKAGLMRADATAQDVMMVIRGVGAVMAITGDACPGQARRQLQIALDGLRARPDQTKLPGRAISATEFDRMLSGWAQGAMNRRGCAGN